MYLIFLSFSILNNTTCAAGHSGQEHSAQHENGVLPVASAPPATAYARYIPYLFIKTHSKRDVYSWQVFSVTLGFVHDGWRHVQVTQTAAQVLPWCDHNVIQVQGVKMKLSEAKRLVSLFCLF